MLFGFPRAFDYVRPISIILFSFSFGLLMTESWPAGCCTTLQSGLSLSPVLVPLQELVSNRVNMRFLSEMHFFPSGLIPKLLIQKHFPDVTDAKHHHLNAKVDDSNNTSSKSLKQTIQFT